VQIQVSSGNIAERDADAIVVQVTEDGRRLAGPAAQVDAALRGALSEMQRTKQIAGRAGEAVTLPSLGRVRAARVVVQGLGKRADLTADQLRHHTAALARTLRGLDAKRVAISTYGADGIAGVAPEDAGRLLAEALVLGLYRFDRHHTKAADRPRGSVEEVALVEPTAARERAVRRGAEQGVILGEAQNLARDFANEPANLMTPTILAERAQQIASEVGLDCTIIERAEAQRLGMGSYLSVASGSEQPPKFIVLRYRGAGAGARPIGLIGKGITFDSGGLSLKPPASMERMKGDMTGAASVIAAIRAIALLKPRVNVLAIAPCTENLPSGRATKPGDVVYAMDGQSIEVINTDAEGRLVLADALAYARTQNCSALVDVATLTGAMSVALGNVRVGVFANQDRLFQELERGAAAAGERLWRMPLYREYGEQIKSDVADMKNSGGAPAGSITAAKFLESFVKDTPWAHFDIAGVMDSARDHGVLVKGISGTGVRTLVHFVLNRAR